MTIFVFYVHWFAMPVRTNYDGACFLYVFGALLFSLVVAGAGDCEKTSRGTEKTSDLAQWMCKLCRSLVFTHVRNGLFSRCVCLSFCIRRHRLRQAKTTKRQKHRGNKLHRNFILSAWQASISTSKENPREKAIIVYEPCRFGWESSVENALLDRKLSNPYLRAPRSKPRGGP